MAGLLMRETAHVLQTGFQRSEVDLDPVVATELSDARRVGLRMQIDGDGTREEGVATLDDLDTLVAELGRVVTEGRR